MFKLKSSVELGELTASLGLTLIGDPRRKIDNVAPISEVSQNTLCFKKSGAHSDQNNVAIASEVASEMTGIHSEQPRLDFIRCLEWLSEQVGFEQNNTPAIVHESAQIGANVFLGNNVKVGKNTVIEPNVVILNNTIIGDDCLIRANTTIASDGFGFERLADGTPVKFVHLGGVIIGDNVEIGANTCIAKGTMGNTVIEDNVKIDNLVHIAHNCVLKNGAYIIACAEISGGVEVGENAWVAPNVSLKQQLKIGREAVVGLGAVVTKDVEEKDIVAGNPAKSFVRKNS